MINIEIFADQIEKDPDGDTFFVSLYDRQRGWQRIKIYRTSLEYFEFYYDGSGKPLTIPDNGIRVPYVKQVPRY